MVIGAGWEQAPLIKRAHELGYWILATHGKEEAEGFQYADKTAILEPRDTNRALALFNEHRIEAVISDNDDYALYTVGLMCQKLGLPGPNFEAITNSNNKRKSRIACEKMGIKQPPFYACATYEDLVVGVEKVGRYPVIVKPVDNRGNFGVNRVESEGELKHAFFDAVINSNSREFVVEKFIEGTPLTVEGFSWNEKTHIPLAVSSKKMLGGSKRVALELIYPAEISEKNLQRAQEITNDVVRALKYDFGYTHTEFIIDTNEDIWLVESTQRGGGVYISTVIVPAITELDMLKYYIELVFGEGHIPTVERFHVTKHSAILSFFKFDSGGTVRSISGLDDVRQLPGVLKCDMLVKVGDMIAPVTTDAHRHGYVVAQASNREVARDLVEKVKKIIVVEFA